MNPTVEMAWAFYNLVRAFAFCGGMLAGAFLGIAVWSLFPVWRKK